MLIRPLLETLVQLSLHFHLNKQSVNKTCALCAKNLSQCEKKRCKREK